MNNEDDDSLFDDLESLFGEVRVNHGGPNRPPVVWECDSFPKISVSVSGSSSTALMAHHVWQSSLSLSTLLAKQKIPGVVINEQSKIVELGAGAALPSIVCDVVLHAKIVIATDYPDPHVLEAMKQNAIRNSCKNLRVMGFSWGESCTALLDAVEGEIDVILAADTLWIPAYHDILLKSLFDLMSQNTILVLAFMHHDHDCTVANSFLSKLEPQLKCVNEFSFNWRKDDATQKSKLDYGDVIIKVFKRRI